MSDNGIIKYNLVRSLARKNPLYSSAGQGTDGYKLVTKVIKQLDRLSIDVLEYLNDSEVK